MTAQSARPGPVDSKNDVREFLMSRRARISPQSAGISSFGNRHVAGLRREEVAALAGVSVEYYSRLERGNLAGVSEPVLESIADALHLDEAERLHLSRLSRAANSTARSLRTAVRRPKITESMQRVLDGMANTAALIGNGRTDLLAANALGRALYSPAYDAELDSPNLARFAFLNPAAKKLYPDWKGAANVAVAMLRTEAGRHPHDPAMTALVGELCTRSDEFRKKWASHNVRTHHNGTKTFQHPVVGELVLSFDMLELPGHSGLAMTAYTAQPGTRSADNLALLASWAATHPSHLTAPDTDAPVH